ncbi:hypothetical protein AUJ38_01230 [bacterium CG1_02_42_9]|nr:MAG: hypothetical protein AUJ38_01230 [bacterium CG1_02_42_9]
MQIIKGWPTIKITTWLKSEEGISLIEVLAAVIVLAIASLGLIGLGISATKKSLVSKSKTVSFELLKEGAEAARMIRDNVNNYNPSENNVWGVQKSDKSWEPWLWQSQTGATYYYYPEKQVDNTNHLDGWKLSFRQDQDCDSATDGDKTSLYKNCYRLETPIDNIVFYRQIKISDSPSSTSKKVEVNVGWYEGNKAKKASSSTLLTSWE